MRLKAIVWVALLVLSVILLYFAITVPTLGIILLTWSLILTLYAFHYIKNKDG